MWNTTPSNECNILHPLRQINSVQEKCTTLKITNAKFWVTHGHLRGLTFEHFQKKLSPGSGWHLRNSNFRSWTNPTNNATRWRKIHNLKNTSAKFWVTHGRLRGLTFEHLKKKLSPGRGWHLRDSKFRSWMNLTNNATPSFQSNPIQNFGWHMDTLEA